MPARLIGKRKHSSVKTGRERAVILLILLVVFLAAYASVMMSLLPGSFARVEPLLPSLLSAMIGVGITVLVTTFSFVFVALSLVSAQFSPRVVRHFWHGDPFRRIFLWVFVAVFGLCFVLQFVDAPRLQLLGITLAGYSIFVLFPSFLSYLADNMNAASIVHSIANRTVAEIEAFHSELPTLVKPPASHVVISSKSGFLERIDTDRLAAVFKVYTTRDSNVRLKIANYLGSFIEVGSALAYTDPPLEISPSMQEQIESCFHRNKFRSIEQDIEYGVRQLVDIGIKAISPAVNDPTTCVNCIRYLGVIMKEIAVRDDRSDNAKLLEAEGIVLKEPTFEQYLDDAFDQIYQFGRRDHVIVRTIVSVMEDILAAVPNPGRAELVIRGIEDMELEYLFHGERESPIALTEQRNYLRKAIGRFYRSAATKLEAFGFPERRAELEATARRIESSIESNR